MILKMIASVASLDVANEITISSIMSCYFNDQDSTDIPFKLKVKMTVQILCCQTSNAEIEFNGIIACPCFVILMLVSIIK